MRWFGQASERGLPAAYNGIGVMSFNGQGVEQNFTAARLAFEAGARGGDADSMYNLVRPRRCPPASRCIALASFSALGHHRWRRVCLMAATNRYAQPPLARLQRDHSPSPCDVPV